MQNAVLAYLHKKGYLYWRQNNIPPFDRSLGAYRKPPKHSRAGVPDVIVVRNGIFIGIECKRRSTGQSKNQKDFQKDLEDAGGKYIVARSVLDIINFGL